MADSSQLRQEISDLRREVARKEEFLAALERHPVSGPEREPCSWHGFVDVDGLSPNQRDLQLRNLVAEASLSALAIADTTPSIVWCNAAFLSMWGYSTREDVVGRHPREFFSNRESADRIVSLVRNQGQWTGQIEARRKDGSTFCALTHANAVKNEQGDCPFLASSFIDITREILQRRALRASEQRYRELVENVPDIVVTTSPDGTIEYASGASREILGLVPGDLLGHDLGQALVADDDWPVLQEQLEGCMRGKDTVCQYRVPDEAGRLRWFRSSCRPSLDERGRLTAHFILTDITESYEATEALQEQHRFFRAVIESLSIPFSVIEIDSKVVLLSNEMARRHGMVAGRHCYERYEGFCCPDNGNVCPIERLQQAGEPITVEHEQTGQDGQATCWELHAFPITDSQGRMTQMIAYSRDITERRRMEEELKRYAGNLETLVEERTRDIELLEQQHRELETVAATGRMAAGIAHEINNPLAGIKACFAVIKKALPEDFERQEFVDLVDDEILRISHIVRQMYETYQADTEASVPVSVFRVVRDLEVLLVPRLREAQVHFRSTVTEELPRVLCPESSLRQVLHNLLSNAIDVAPIHTQVTLTGDLCHDQVKLSVSDQGPGIASDILPRIFEPFFTTKREQSVPGMGLGLAISHSLVQAMGGRLVLRAADTPGAVFDLFLPRCESEEPHP